MIAALYVQADGCYAGLPDVDPWPEARDARTYAGPQMPDPPDCPWSDVRTFQKPPPGAGQAWCDQRRAWLRWRRDHGLRVYATPELMSRAQRAATPEPFRDLLLSIARTAGQRREVA